MIRIYCPQSPKPEDTHYQDYKVTSYSTSSESGNSLGKIALADVDAEPLEWNENAEIAHNFYAVYPSPATEGVASGYAFDITDEDPENTSAIVSLAFPAEQTPAAVTGSASGGYVAAPDTRYLYMVAQAKNIKEADAKTRPVFLKFLPAVTAIEFTIKNDFSNNAVMNLEKVFLETSTEGGKLYGTSTCDLYAWSGETGVNPSFSAPTDGGNEVAIPFGGADNPTAIEHGAEVKFTFLLPPHADATNLKFGFTAAIGDTGTKTTRKIALSYTDGTPIVFDAGLKHFVKGLLAPDKATLVYQSINSTGVLTEPLEVDSNWQ